MHKRKPTPSSPSPQKRLKQTLSSSLLSNNSSIIHSLTKPPTTSSHYNPIPPLMLTEDFQEGTDDTSLNNLLTQITQNLHFEDIFAKPTFPLPKSTHSSSKHLPSKFHRTSTYEYDYSLYTHIEIEIVFTNTTDDATKQNFISNTNAFLHNENNFVYYEYSNTKNMNYFALSSIDQIQYEFYYKDNFSEMFRIKTMKNKLELLNKLKQINYVNALTSLYKTFYENKSEFYILTSLHAYYFNCKDSSVQKTKRNNKTNNKYKGILLTNTISLYKRLCDYDIELIKLDNNTIHDKLNNHSMVIDENDIDDSPAFIRYEDMTLFYNVFIEDHHNKNFNVISPFNFEESACRKCKFNIKHFTKNTSTVITINIHGCIFQTELEKIVNHIHTSKNAFSLKQLTYTMKLTRISTTDPFYIVNSNLTKPTNKVEYKDNEYYFK